MQNLAVLMQRLDQEWEDIANKHTHLNKMIESEVNNNLPHYERLIYKHLYPDIDKTAKDTLRIGYIWLLQVLPYERLAELRELHEHAFNASMAAITAGISQLLTHNLTPVATYSNLMYQFFTELSKLHYPAKVKDREYFFNRLIEIEDLPHEIKNHIAEASPGFEVTKTTIH